MKCASNKGLGLVVNFPNYVVSCTMWCALQDPQETLWRGRCQQRIYNSKSSFLNKISVSETVYAHLTGRVVYWAFVDLSHCKIAIWFCWPF